MQAKIRFLTHVRFLKLALKKFRTGTFIIIFHNKKQEVSCYTKKGCNKTVAADRAYDKSLSYRSFASSPFNDFAQ